MRRWWRSIFENKEGTAAHFKGGFGFHPMFCFADATGETLAAELRPGNATANNAADLLAVLDASVSQLPAQVAAGHRCSDDPELVSQPVVVRSDSAGASRAFVDALRDRNVGFAVVARRKPRFPLRFRPPTPIQAGGGQPSTKTAPKTTRQAAARQQRCVRSPTLLTCRRGPRALG